MLMVLLVAMTLVQTLVWVPAFDSGVVNSGSGISVRAISQRYCMSIRGCRSKQL